jgi:hypothetical protein
MKKTLRLTAAAALPMLFPALARAADFDGAVLSPLWGVPFAGILLSIALLPLLAPAFWHHHYGKISAPGRWPSCCPLPPPTARGSRARSWCMRWWPSTSRSSSC